MKNYTKPVKINMVIGGSAIVEFRRKGISELHSLKIDDTLVVQLATEGKGKEEDCVKVLDYIAEEIA